MMNSCFFSHWCYVKIMMRTVEEIYLITLSISFQNRAIELFVEHQQVFYDYQLCFPVNQ